VTRVPVNRIGTLGWRVAHETHMNTFNNIQKMESNEKKITELPKNAYRELQPGEEYKPVLPADRPVAEATPWAIGMGLLMAVISSLPRQPTRA